MTEVIFSAGVVVGTGVAAGIPGVTSGVRVAGDMTAGTAEGKILKVPDTWRIPRAAMMRMIAITATTKIFGIPPWAGCGPAATGFVGGIAVSAD